LFLFGVLKPLKLRFFLSDQPSQHVAGFRIFLALKASPKPAQILADDEALHWTLPRSLILHPEAHWRLESHPHRIVRKPRNRYVVLTWINAAPLSDT
jgi:hypothetical protein